MTHAVMRGQPTKAQLYLESLIKDLITESGREEDRYCVNKLLFKVFRDNPNDFRHIEGTTGEMDSNKTLLERSILTVRALHRAGVQVGDTVMSICKNNLDAVGMYYGCLFGGFPLFMLGVNVTQYELMHYFKLNDEQPKIIFIDKSLMETVEGALKQLNWNTRVVVFQEEPQFERFSDFVSGLDGNFENFSVAETNRDTIIFMTGTSGSSGLPKASFLTNRGFMAQIPNRWTYCETYPRPTFMALCTSNPGWISFTMCTVSSAAMGVPVLYTISDINPENMVVLLRKYKPSECYITVPFVNELLASSVFRPTDLACFKQMFLSGSAIPASLIHKLKEKYVKPDANVSNGYGMTELHGLVSMTEPGKRVNSIGTPFNCFLYRIVDEDDKIVAPNTHGELQIKSKECLIRGYMNNEEAYNVSFTSDGWFKTGDRVYVDNSGTMYFVEKIKFVITVGLVDVLPSELETLIGTIDGVENVAIVGSELGVAAMILLQRGKQADPQHIHDVVNNNLCDEKRLRGGVVFIEKLPLLNSSKLDRRALKDLINSISNDKKHFDKNIETNKV